MKRRKVLLVALTGISLLLIIITVYRSTIYELYVVLLNRTVVIETFNSQKKLNGRFVSYIKGRRYVDAYFINGKREGLVRKYYENGQVEREVLYKNDLMNGIETEYYDNGNINYTVRWVDNKRVGEEFHYLDDKKLNNYTVFESGEPFLVVEYGSEGGVKNIIGSVISNSLYSGNLTADSRYVIIYQHSYRENIRELSFSIGKPPRLHSNIKLLINGNDRKDFTIHDNTVILKKAFDGVGTYRILVVGTLINDKNQAVKADTVSYTIKKI